MQLPAQRPTLLVALLAWLPGAAEGKLSTLLAALTATLAALILLAGWSMVWFPAGMLWEVVAGGAGFTAAAVLAYRNFGRHPYASGLTAVLLFVQLPVWLVLGALALIANLA